MKHHSNFQGIALTHKLAAILITLAMIASTFYTQPPEIQASGYSFIILSNYNKTLKVGQPFYLAAVSTSGKRITWKSSNSRVAAVNTYGQVTAKKAGTCKITAKTSGAETSCHITVNKTVITLSASTVTMENGAVFRLTGTTSNNSGLTWKSSRPSVASIDDNGTIRAEKTGETVITATADGGVSGCAKKTCRVTVKKPKVTLSHSKIELYRTQSCQLTAKVSSGRSVTWKSNKSSIATVNERGVVTAKKHGTATITAKVDGVTKECEVTVKTPVIQLSQTKVTLKKGKSLTLLAKVSSGISPTWSSSKKSVATVNQKGRVTAIKKGTCYIYASEDGAKEGCYIKVTA